MTVWTPARKWFGNLIPSLFWLLPVAAGLYSMFKNQQPSALGLGLILAGTVAGWIALNYFGLYQNSAMRRQLSRILEADALLPADRLFVGISTPKYTGLLDAHEDVGFLCFFPDVIRFVSETRTIEVERSDVRRVIFRPNVHSLVGLGRWVCVEGERNGTPIRLMLEPREKATMLGNLQAGRPLLRRVEAWRREAAPQLQHGSK